MRFPLFPLNTVLFPDGHLPLRIFEVRYLDMVSRCAAEGTPDFGTELFQGIGTLATIEHIDRTRPGLIGIRCKGGQRFRITQSEQLPHGLWMAEAELLDQDAEVAVPDDLAWLGTRLQQWIAQINAHLVSAQADDTDMPVRPPMRWSDCGWVANRFGEMLPLETGAKQNLMALRNPLVRLELVSDVVEQMDSAEAAGGS